MRVSNAGSGRAGGLNAEDDRIYRINITEVNKAATLDCSAANEFGAANTCTAWLTRTTVLCWGFAQLY